MANVINILPIDVLHRLKQGEKLTILDVREPEEVRMGKIPGAKHISLGEIPSRYMELDPAQELIIVCRSGGRSTAACEFLQNVGFRHVKNMMGGMLAWEGEVE